MPAAEETDTQGIQASESESAPRSAGERSRTGECMGFQVRCRATLRPKMPLVEIRMRLRRLSFDRARPVTTATVTGSNWTVYAVPVSVRTSPLNRACGQTERQRERDSVHEEIGPVPNG